MHQNVAQTLDIYRSPKVTYSRTILLYQYLARLNISHAGISTTTTQLYIHVQSLGFPSQYQFQEAVRMHPHYQYYRYCSWQGKSSQPTQSGPCFYCVAALQLLCIKTYKHGVLICRSTCLHNNYYAYYLRPCTHLSAQQPRAGSRAHNKRQGLSLSHSYNSLPFSSSCFSLRNAYIGAGIDEYIRAASTCIYLQLLVHIYMHIYLYIITVFCYTGDNTDGNTLVQ